MTTGTYARYRSVLSDTPLPLAYLDREALAANVRTTRKRAGDLPIRVASKSIRCRALLRYVLEHDGFCGIMCYTGREAVHLAQDGFDDLLVAYPMWDTEEIVAVCNAIESGTQIVLMVDSRSHVERIAQLATERGVEVPLCLDVDMSTTHFGIHFGVRRSGLRSPSVALALARTIAECTGVTLTGVMGYEAQIAGLPDRNPSNGFLKNAVIRLLKRRSAPRLRKRRGSVVQVLEEGGFELSFVNGGGTGSIESTKRDDSVTELTVGSGFFAPTLFDHYRRFGYEPAAGYAIEIVRQPTQGTYTCRGGGYVASGPPGIDKAPTPHLPAGTTLLENEGAGEVQTPVSYDGPVDLALGDPVFFRHAKAGELCARFDEICVIEGREIVARHPTYRGDGACFL